MSRIAYLTNATTTSGVGHVAGAVAQALKAQGSNHTLEHFFIDGTNHRVQYEAQTLMHVTPWPGQLNQKTVNWLRLGYKLKRSLASRHDLDIIHATNQTLSFIIDERRPSVVTVHDIIELIDPQNWAGGIAARWLYRGITQASHIIAVSQYTAHELITKLAVPQAKITVVPNGVSPHFYLIENFQQSVAYHTLQQELKISGQKIILYVGSEHPRKNVPAALAAFAKVHAKNPHTIFLKVGEAGLRAGRQTTLETIDHLSIQGHVRLLGTVSPERLNELYNLADVFIYPSLHEGFGLPVLEAMAAGTPVVTSSATSLPEVVGSAALISDPRDIEMLTTYLLQVLENEAVATQMKHNGLEQAKQFSWARAAQAVSHVYDQLT
ncbi:MAG: glycosyltransferase family 1 protein, partial [Candidatus Andersenbacteria bacterium]